MNTSLGMLTSIDPVQGVVGAQSVRWNPYIYAGANPVNYTDPSGELFWMLLAIPAIAMGAYVGGNAAVNAYNGDPLLHNVTVGGALTVGAAALIAATVAMPIMAGGMALGAG